jgi:ribosomal protein S27E
MNYHAAKYEYVECDLCGRSNYTIVIEKAKDLYNNLPGEFNVVKCNKCGLVFTNPRPYGKELEKYYPDNAGYFNPTPPQRLNLDEKTI